MGWTGRHDTRPAHEVVVDEIQEGGGYSVVGRSGRYYAVRNNTTGTVFGLVALVRRERGGYILTKLVTEDMGPCESRCPERILAMLSPAQDEYALAWRERCRANAAAGKTAPKLEPGTVVQIDPMAFTNGEIVTRFTYLGGFRGRSERGTGIRLPRNWRTAYRWSVAEGVTA